MEFLSLKGAIIHTAMELDALRWLPAVRLVAWSRKPGHHSRQSVPCFLILVFAHSTSSSRNPFSRKNNLKSASSGIALSEIHMCTAYIFIIGASIMLKIREVYPLFRSSRNTNGERRGCPTSSRLFVSCARNSHRGKWLHPSLRAAEEAATRTFSPQKQNSNNSKTNRKKQLERGEDHARGGRAVDGSQKCY